MKSKPHLQASYAQHSYLNHARAVQASEMGTLPAAGPSRARPAARHSSGGPDAAAVVMEPVPPESVASSRMGPEWPPVAMEARLATT